MKTTELTPLERAWDLNSRAVQEQFYDTQEIAWVIGKDVMLKEDFDLAAKDLVQEEKKQLLERLINTITDIENKVQMANTKIILTKVQELLEAELKSLNA